MNEGQNRVDLITGFTFGGSFLACFLATGNLLFSLGVASPAIVLGIIIHVLTFKPKVK